MVRHPGSREPRTLWQSVRGMHAAPRVWRHAVLAWLVLIAGPTGNAAVRWQMGVGRDIDMSGVHELILAFVIVFAAPMAALAFGVFAPLAVGIEYVLQGRASRFVNALLGAALSLPAFVVTVLVVGWPQQVFASAANLQRAIGFLAALPLAGMIVGLGMQHRGSMAPVTRRSALD
jgi:hypothetical protein